MTIQNLGPCDWWATRDEEGYREYHIVFKIQSTAPYRWNGSSYSGDGPEAISRASGLPAIGDPWIYGNDSDLWAFCKPTRSVRPYDQKEGESISFWKVDCTFSTKPTKRCQTESIENPLLEPQKVRGASSRYTIEAFKDRFGNPIMSSSHEMIRGPQVEVDGGRDQVIIEQNVPALQLGLCTSLRNKLNDDVLWGLAARRIKLSDFTWEEKWYGICSYYYTRVFTFDIRNNADDLWDRDILDEGTKVLSGKWTTEGTWQDVPIGGVTPDPLNPQHFIRYKDRNDENARCILDGKGRPADSVLTLGTGSIMGAGTDSTDPAGQIHFEYYEEADFTQLGIPTTIDYGT